MDDDYPLGEYLDVIPRHHAPRTRYWSASFVLLGTNWGRYSSMPLREVTA